MTSTVFCLQSVAALPGVLACALIDPETGMVWHHAGDLPERERIAEAAVEFWRVQLKLRADLAVLGTLKSSLCSFEQHVLGFFNCETDPPLVMLCVADKTRVAWAAWRPALETLKAAVLAEYRH